jgi:hypothetical protein
MTEWTDLVKRVYNQNKHKPGYKLGNAMKDAAAMRKGNKSMSVSGPVKKTARHRKGKRGTRGRKRGGSDAMPPMPTNK